MIDAYVINLEKDILRKELLIKNTNEHNVTKYINLIYMKAIDESSFCEFKFKICNTWYDHNLKTGITSGEVGCSLSHYKCWIEFFNSNKKEAIIFEDDIEFLPDFYKNLQILLYYPSDSDIVYINRKPLKKIEETKYNDNFINIKANYWTCGYLLTRKGVEKLLKANFLDNLIVVDEFLPILYDLKYLQQYQKYYNIKLNGYAIKTSFITLKNNESNTYHSNYYKYDNNYIVITNYTNTSLSSMSRFIYSCEKYSLNIEIIKDGENIIDKLDTIDDNKIIIISESNFSFFINNPLLIYENDIDYLYYDFNNLNDFITKYNNNTANFYGKNYELKNILNSKTPLYSNNINNIKLYLSNKDNNICNNDYILINGLKNQWLLNKYENYVLYKISSFYSLKLNNLTTYTFKIRVNILAHILNYKNCLKCLEKIDYPKDLLDIHIYTNQQIVKENIKIHNLSIFEAYKEMYYYYTQYDYIWFLNSNNLIQEPSLLKNCINTNKNISSGLHKSQTTLLSNFWGELSPNGWYKRSDDYIDIINLNKINIWNVPYINGNVLIKSSILNKYDNIFKNINFDITDNSDMILCENFRLLNESLYLLNNKVYGNILEHLDGIDWYEQDILHKDFYNFLYNNKNDIFNEIGTDIWHMPFFSPEFCKHLIELAEKANIWSAGSLGEDKYDERIGNIEPIPTQDVHLKDLNLDKFWKYVVSNYFKKILSHLYKYLIKDCHISFIVKYDYDNGQRLLKPHHDSSVYTINIALNSSDEYTGGGVNFIHKKCSFLNKTPGYLLLHPGRVTHYHEAIPITSGKRYILVSFNN